jgi:hypothetical protein
MFEGGFGPFTKSADDGTPETIAAPAACPTVVQGAPAAGQIGVLPAVPALRFTAADQLRTVRVRVINRSSIPITVEDISEQVDELFSVWGVTPTLPRTVRPNRSMTFFVQVMGPSTGEVTFPYSPVRPYFNVDINCEGPTAVSPAAVEPQRPTLKAVRIEQRGGLLRFEAQGTGIAELQVELFDLMGRLVLKERGYGTELVATASSAQGKPLANGVYLYVVTVRGYDGSIVRSEVRKLAIVR